MSKTQFDRSIGGFVTGIAAAGGFSSVRGLKLLLQRLDDHESTVLFLDKDGRNGVSLLAFQIGNVSSQIVDCALHLVALVGRLLELTVLLQELVLVRTQTVALGNQRGNLIVDFGEAIARLFLVRLAFIDALAEVIALFLGLLPGRSCRLELGLQLQETGLSFLRALFQGLVRRLVVSRQFDFRQLARQSRNVTQHALFLLDGKRGRVDLGPQILNLLGDALALLALVGGLVTRRRQALLQIQPFLTRLVLQVEQAVLFRKKVVKALFLFILLGRNLALQGLEQLALQDGLIRECATGMDWMFNARMWMVKKMQVSMHVDDEGGKKEHVYHSHIIQIWHRRAFGNK